MCKSCKGAGLVAPSPFHGDWVPWPEHYAKAVELHRGKGYPVESSYTLTGVLRPIPCPDCTAEKGGPK